MNGLRCADEETKEVVEHLLGLELRQTRVDIVVAAPESSSVVGDATIHTGLDQVDTAVDCIEEAVEFALVALLCGDPRLHEEVEAAGGGCDEGDCDGERNVFDHLFLLSFCVYCIRFAVLVKVFSIVCFVVVVLVWRHLKHLFEANVGDAASE